MTKKTKPKRQKDFAQQPAGQPEAPPVAAPEAPHAPAAPADDPAGARAGHDEMLARLQRVSADYQNYQKRVRRDVAQVREYANEELMKALLGILDDMDRALEAGRANHDAQDPLLTGLQLARDNALAVLGRFGLASIEALGRPFDPAQHSAVMQQPTADHPPQTILSEIQKGYRFKDRTLRPSSVVVAGGERGDPPGEQDRPPAAGGNETGASSSD